MNELHALYRNASIARLATLRQRRTVVLRHGPNNLSWYRILNSTKLLHSSHVSFNPCLFNDDTACVSSGVNLVWNLGSWIRVKILWFSRKISEKFWFFSGNFRNNKSIFQGKFPKNLDYFQVISQKISIFQVTFPKNFDLFRQFPKIFRCSREISKKIWFFQAI